MPIRFRCVYCDKLLGIARRKAGAVVNCPHCAEKLIVPTPDPSDVESNADDDIPGTEDEEVISAAVAAGRMRLFENSDVDALLEERPTFRTGGDGTDPAPPAVVPFPSVPQVRAYIPPPAPAVVPPPPPAPPAPPRPTVYSPPPLQHGITISASKLTWLSVGGVVLLALVFGVGLILGRMMK